MSADLPLAPTITGAGEITSWEINATLPDGLSFGATNGTIWGTPTELSSTTAYMVWANNSGGSSVAYLNITVVDELPTISYTLAALDLANNTVSADLPLAPTITGAGEITSWEINATLPDGLSFGATNGTIWGTPTELWTQTSYMVWANNSGGSSVAYLNITVVDEVPTLSYTPNSLVLTKGQQSNDFPLTAALSGSGVITSWEINATLPAGLNFGTSNGTIWGIPTVLQTTASTYTIWANNTGGSTSATVTITINDQVSGPFEYIPEDNTWTNNSYVNIGPSFINTTTGNGSTWEVANINSGSASSNAGQYMITSIGDVIYFSANAANAGHELWAYNASNSTTWLVKEIRPGSSGSNPGGNMVHAINGVLYFNAMDGSSGQELWKHDPSTGTTSRVYDIRPGSSGSSIGSKMSMVVDDVLFFSANDGNSGHELWAYNTSNGSNPWRVMDINSGSDSSNPGDNMAVVVGDTLYFDADDGSAGLELWAHDTSNQSTWQVTDISSGSGNGNPGRYMQILVGDTIYFSATDDSTGDELWAHDTSNHSTWQVADINHWIMMGGAGLSSNPGEYMAVSVGDTIYFSAAVEQQGAELWAHDISNQSTWRVVEIYTGSIGSNPGENMAVVVGDTLYFDANDGISGEELWAHDTSNHSTWRVTDIINGVSGSSPAAKMSILVGDTIYFDADDYFDGHELWAHDVSNQSTWQVADISGGSRSSNPGHISEILVGDTLYFSADDGNTGFELWAHRPSLINHQTNTGGSVTSYAINATLPEGLSFGTNNGTIWGTPTELWTQTSYMVWANNSGGSSLAYLNITVVDELPTVAYTPAVLDLTNNTVSADLPLAPTIIGAGEITSWEINATLPDGLSFGAANGTIWGTPTELLSTTAYMVWANNSGGSSVAYLNITVVDELPTVAYTPATLDLTNNTVSADLPLAPTITGAGEITSWEINATLPDGLSLGSTNGTIWGTPTELLSTTAYMVWANNSGGSSVAYLNITVVDELPTVAYTPAALDLTNNTVSADLPLAPTITGAGEITSWEINATLPDGLSFGATNGTIWGTPTELWTTTAYMVWANNSGGSSVAYLNITVVDELPTISYSPSDFQLMNNTASSDLPLVPVITGSGEITSWEINATLPDGLSFGATNGTIWGTPTELWTTTGYMVWANNSGGSSVAYLNITVVDELPALSYNPNNLELTNNTQSSDFPLNPTIIGSGEITSWEINATLPAGLNFGTSNGTIWGVPTVLQTTAVTYTIWANNSGGSTSATINITINDEAPGPFEYIPENNTWTNNSYVNIGPSFINQTSGNGSRWSVSLPKTDYAVVVGDVVYLNGAYIPFSGDEFYAFNTSNGTAWAPNPTWYLENGSTSGSTTFNHGRYMSYLIGDVIYFDAECKISWCDQFGVELWAYNTSNNSGWLVKEINTVNINNLNFNSNPGERFSTLMGDTIYFSADSGNASLGTELWAHDTSNGTTWRVGHTNTTGLPSTSAWPLGQNLGVIADTFYFQAWGSGGNGLWAYNTSNTTMWRHDISSGVTSSNPGKCMALVVGDTLYFDADGGYTGRELWAHNHVNQTSWLAKDFRTTNYHSQLRDGNPGCSQTTRSTSVLYEDTIYLVAMDQSIGLHLFAYDTSNHSAWPVVGTNNYHAGQNLLTVIDDTIYFDAPKSGLPYAHRQLWAHDTSNQTSWIVHDFSLSGGQGISKQLMVVGDTIYFRACGYSNCYPQGLWAHDTSNQSTWLVENGSSGDGTSFFVDGTLYTHTGNCNGYSPGCTLGYNLLSINYQTNTGGNVTSWAINGSLPSGVTFNTQTGVLSGTPTELWPQTSYMVWANNSGGSSVAYLNITVVDELPTIAYSPTDLTLTNNTVSTDLPLVPTITGPGEITSWVINASLPAGLTFETSNGTIWGTPTELWNTTAYTVWANNSGGSSVAYLNITVIDQLPTIAYSPANIVLTNNTASTDLPLIPTLTGAGEITSWAINGSLPAGLTFETSNGTIWGTPTELWNTTAYMVWANNSGGSIVAYLNITVIDELPTISYTPFTLSLINNTVSVDFPLGPTITGAGEITSWAINATLPAGVQFGSDNGTFWGTPTELWNTTAYMVWANNTGGSSVTYLNITVVDELPTISYTPFTLNLTNNTVTADLPLAPTISGPGVITSWAINATLPTGIQFGTDNGTFWGVATQLWEEHSYIVWANNSGGSSFTIVNLSVVDQVPNLTYAIDKLELVNNTINMSMPLLPTLTGPGEITSWAINATLPAGIQFGAGNGTFWGVPTELWPETNYTVWANNSGGSTSTSILLVVVDQLPLLSYDVESIELTNDTSHDSMPLLAVLTGPGEITSWAISGELPTGLNFSESNGTIWGVATELWPETVYTIWANNSGGSSFANLSITVLDQLPAFSYTSLEIIMQNNSELSLSPLSTGGNIANWSISPELSPGLYFDNGTLYGVATSVKNKTMYVITATNEIGSTTFNLNITVSELLYDTSYGERFEIRGKEMQPYGPELSLDDAVYAINPMLPEGLFIGSDNGTIWGTPTQVFELTRFTIFSNSSSFNDTFVIYIQVLEDTDQDGKPDEVPDGVNPSLGLIEDVDDDDDGWTDEEEFTCGSTDSKDASSVPVDSDGDGICDFMEELIITYQGEDFEFIQGQTNISLMAFSSGMVVDTWEISPSLPEGMLFGSETLGGNGTIYGIPIYASLFNTYTITATNSLTNFQATTTLNLSVIADFDLDGKSDNTSRLGLFEIDADDDNDGYEDAIELACDSDPYDRTSLPRVDDENNCITDDDISESSDEDNAQSGFGTFFILAFLSTLAAISFILWRRKNRTGVRPEYVTSKPKFTKGDGFEFEPYTLKDAVVPYNGIAESEEVIECSEMTPNTSVKFVDKNSDVNAGRFRAIISGGPRNGETKLRSNEYGVMSIKFTFDGSIRPEEDGAEYQAEIILDDETHFVWKVETEKRKWMTQESIEEDFDDIADKTPEESEDDDSEIESEDESKKQSKKDSKKKSKKETKKEPEDKSEKSSEKSQDKKVEGEQDSDKEKASDTDDDSETKSDEESDEGSEDESKKSSKKGSKKKSEKESKKPSSKDKTEKSSEKLQDEKAEGEEDPDEEKSSDKDDDSETKSDKESDEGSEDESEEESEKETSEDESETEPSDKSDKESSDDKTEKSSEKSSKKKAKGEDGDSNKKKTSGSKKQSETKSEKKPKQNKKKSSKSKK